MENNSSASERWLLRGAPNARDLGGLPTMDGRTIRPGLLLRSGELAGITEPDAQTLTEYPLRTVVDFRTDLEREQKPDCVLPGVQYVHCPIVQQAAAGLTREEHADPYAAVVAHAKAMAGRERAFMCELYRSLVTQEFAIAHYRQFFVLLPRQTGRRLLHNRAVDILHAREDTVRLLLPLQIRAEVHNRAQRIARERLRIRLRDAGKLAAAQQQARTDRAAVRCGQAAEVARVRRAAQQPALKCQRVVFHFSASPPRLGL